MKDLEKDFIIARLVVIVNYRKGAYFQAWIVGEEPNDKGVTETLIMAPEHQFEFGHNFRDWLMTINNSKLKDKDAHLNFKEGWFSNLYRRFLTIYTNFFEKNHE